MSIAKDHLDILYGPFKKAQAISVDVLIQYRGKLNRFKSQVKKNFKQIKDKALLESKFIRDTFTWENAAKIADRHISEAVEFNKISVNCSDKPKLLYVCPHLSTGGQPQYTLKQIQNFSKNYEYSEVMSIKSKLNHDRKRIFKNEIIKQFEKLRRLA